MDWLSRSQFSPRFGSFNKHLPPTLVLWSESFLIQAVQRTNFRRPSVLFSAPRCGI